jgi:pantoate--beta-alanine ligase
VILVSEIQEARDVCRKAKREGGRIVLVPTMGFLHDGHLSLVRRGKELGDFLVVTIFVNPVQFGPQEDLAKYPRDLAGDRKRLEELGVDLLFCPSETDLYPPGYETYVSPEVIAQKLCGAYRPGHFRGVATILTKLFHVLEPDVAVFGEKDYQQLVATRKMVRDLNFPVTVVAAPTVREADGLAMSSRNHYLSAEEREAAHVVPRSLQTARALVAAEVQDSRLVLEAVRKSVGEEPLARLEYAEICDPDTLEDLSRIGERALLAVAVWIGKTRLIDNTMLSLHSAEKQSSERIDNGITHAQG